MAQRKVLSHDIKKVTCEGCAYVEPVAMVGHGYCSHPRVRMIQVIKSTKRCIWACYGKAE